MKRVLSLAAAWLLCLSCSTEKTCDIRGTVTVPDTAQPCQAVLFEGNVSLDSCRINGNAFTLKTKRSPERELRIEIHDEAGQGLGSGELFDYVLDIVPDVGKMKVDLDAGTSEGSPLTATLNDFVRQLDRFLMEPDPALTERMAAAGDDPEKMAEVFEWNAQRFISLQKDVYLAHTGDAVGLQALRMVSGMINADELKTLLAQGAGFIQEDKDIQQSLLFAEAAGKESGAAEHVRIDADGSILSRESTDAATLYDTLAGQGQYMLLDFWASWCGPCREEIPNVISLARKYAGKNLKVIGITVKDEPAASLAAIRELGICYDQIFDLEGILCNKFPFAGIPHFFLLDPSGEIILEGSHNLADFDALLRKRL